MSPISIVRHVHYSHTPCLLLSIIVHPVRSRRTHSTSIHHAHSGHYLVSSDPASIVYIEIFTPYFDKISVGHLSVRTQRCLPLHRSLIANLATKGHLSRPFHPNINTRPHHTVNLAPSDLVRSNAAVRLVRSVTILHFNRLRTARRSFTIEQVAHMPQVVQFVSGAVGVRPLADSYRE